MAFTIFLVSERAMVYYNGAIFENGTKIDFTTDQYFVVKPDTGSEATYKARVILE
ncbi:MAG: hypothetical protein HC896_12030 [Bacteroidales bacterium]|nr:hypothetical protein [Bacteroidales bacterium]